MWTKARSQSTDERSSCKEWQSKRTTYEVLPCNVSQLLAASQVGNDTFTICGWELNQVSVVGIIRGTAPFVTNIQYSVDDMTGPPLNVKQWVNSEDCAPMTSASTGTYVKVIGSLRSFSGQRSMLAMDIRCITDLNEITSHMLGVVKAHMLLFRKTFDVNMNTTAASFSGRVLEHRGCGPSEDTLPYGLSTIQSQVLHVLRKFSSSDIGISFHELQKQLDYISGGDLGTSLTFLINEGHAFYTIDEQHFKSTKH